MGAVEKTPVTILKVVIGEACHNRRVAHVRYGNDEAATRVEKIAGQPERCPWIVKMLENISDDDSVKFLSVEGAWPVRLIQIRMKHFSAESAKEFDAFRVALDGGNLTSVAASHHTRD